MPHGVYIASLMSEDLNRAGPLSVTMRGKDSDGVGEEPVGFVATLHASSSGSLEMTVPKAVVDMLRLKDKENVQFTIKRRR